MNRSIWFVVMTVGIVLMSCSNEIDINSISKPVSVCYCLLDLNSEDQYLRLSQSYLDADKEPSILDSVHIYVEEWFDNEAVAKFVFNKISTGWNQELGVGFTIWWSEFKIKPNTLYKLYGWMPDSKKIFYGETQTITRPVILDPALVPGRTITFDNTSPYFARFMPGKNTYVYQNGFRLSQGQDSAEYFRDNIFRFGGSQQIESRFGGVNVLNSVYKSIPDINTQAIHVDYELISAGIEVGFVAKEYAQKGQFFENINDFSNLINGLGVFSSISTTQVHNIELSQLSKDVINLRSSGFYINSKASVSFKFPMMKRPGVNEKRVHRIDLSVANTMDSLLQKKFIRSANTSDFADEYSFQLPPGEYVYQAGIVCVAAGDSCLWSGFPKGQFGSLWTSGKFEVLNEGITDVHIHIR